MINETSSKMNADAHGTEILSMSLRKLLVSLPRLWLGHITADMNK